MEKKMVSAAFGLCLVYFAGLPAWSATVFFVSPAGNDANPGTFERPLAKVQTAIFKTGPGDTVFLRGGTYRETVDLSNNSGTPENPVRIAGYKDEKAVFDGRDPVVGTWKPYKGRIFQIDMTNNVEQLFIDDLVMTEARWPNAKFKDRWDRSKWAKSDVGSEHGRMISSDFETSDVDWNGAYAVLNINHQWHTWIRPVLNYNKETRSFEYDKKLPELEETFAKRISWYWDDFFYLFGKREALDAAEEWFYDAKEKILYFYPPENASDPSGQNVSFKKRDYGLRGRNMSHIIIENIQFTGCTVDFQNTSFITIDNCHFRYPCHSRFIKELEGTFSHTPDRTPGTKVHGDHNAIVNSSLAYSSTYGFYVKGAANLISNCVIHDVNYYGPLVYRGIDITDTGAHGSDKAFNKTNVVTRNTVYNVGNVAIEHRGTAREITYNHIFNGGLTSRDVSLIYTASPSYFTNTVAYNWVHGSTQIGIRGDNETYNLSIHHNVVWDCIEGIYEKGNRNRIYNNTCFANQASMAIVVSMWPLKFSDWQLKTWDFTAAEAGKTENLNTLCYNNVAASLRNARENIQPTDNIRNNFLFSGREEAEGLFENLKELDVRPRQGGRLVDAGVAPGESREFQGSAPDIGAYECGGEFWVPGAAWLDDGETPPKNLMGARELAIRKLGYDASEIWWKRDLNKLKELEKDWQNKKKARIPE